MGLFICVGLACDRDIQVEEVRSGEDKQAHPFVLQNQFGDVVRLSDFRGDVVVLSFIYTSCDDVCPLITSKLLDTFEILGKSKENVQFVTITVDPERDSVEQAYRYSLNMNMLDKWFFLVGSREALAPIWKGYFLEVKAGTKSSSVTTNEDDDVGYSATASSTLTNAGRSIIDAYQIGHSAPIFLISKDGVLSHTFSAASLDIETLAIAIRMLLER